MGFQADALYASGKTLRALGYRFADLCRFPLRSLPSDPPLLPGSTSLGYTLSFPAEFLHFFSMLPKVPDTNFQSFPLCFLNFLHHFSFQSYHIPWVTLCHQILMVVAGFGGFAFSFWLLVVLVVFGRPSLVVQPLPSHSDGC